MSAGAAGVVAAAAFSWFGMVAAISFLEAPLKFGAPGVTLEIGVGIGRRVFRALNAVEVLLAAVTAVAVVAGGTSAGVAVPAAAVLVLLAVQLLAVRPVLNRRSDRLLAGEEHPRSRVHFVYIALELLKIAGLVVLGVAALGAV
ncbi:hypothetical protein [Streptomyces sp. ODS28]|uniref:hypothetical protein n=1 Tax=Streptomyces sp. ODS28 TaxID=3136688 RepID=UPI0031EC63F5